MKKLVKKGRRFIALASALALVASPILINVASTTAMGGGDIWLIGGW